MKDNAFTDVSDPDALHQAAREIDENLIQQRIDYWMNLFLMTCRSRVPCPSSQSDATVDTPARFTGAFTGEAEVICSHASATTSPADSLAEHAIHFWWGKNDLF